MNYNPKKWRTVTKTFQSNVIPSVKDRIESSAFESDEEVRVVEIVINYEEDYAYIYLEVLNIETNDDDVLKSQVDMYMSHGWDCGYYGFDESE
ncbi:hypothetical protein [Paenisporosarcina sp. NPDC076898]|uniref:hypothetical protein n=1 Tax=unclassified Paenisporosarcina TaxID=2642018 RepID=UPI003CFE1999